MIPVPGTKQTERAVTPLVRWRALTARQQRALTRELARLFCQYVQEAAQREVETGSGEVGDERPG